ncbi:hypothetical protein B0T19DRAFT_172910 [Cercophora scortea]|uniref:Uncharacterized protein n=1 Tax=Cercophora scortea TaxID=314031 RepID=A0AAE0IMJ9_9PEZI|nr:hypothetical protein B0T19DRAFT_172910 [Cercophora scortea]
MQRNIRWRFLYVYLTLVCNAWLAGWLACCHSMVSYFSFPSGPIVKEMTWLADAGWGVPGLACLSGLWRALYPSPRPVPVAPRWGRDEVTANIQPLLAQTD